ncbi:MAG: carboxypeptidase-like regulatory domain-containing protein, partial [Bacteroidales bacterium]
MKLKLWVLFLSLFSISAYAQEASLKGVIIDAETGEPIQGVTVLLKENKQTAVTSKDGIFRFATLNEGLDVLSVESPTIFPVEKNITLRRGKNNAGEIKVRNRGNV